MLTECSEKWNIKWAKERTQIKGGSTNHRRLREKEINSKDLKMHKFPNSFNFPLHKARMLDSKIRTSLLLTLFLSLAFSLLASLFFSFSGSLYSLPWDSSLLFFCAVCLWFCGKRFCLVLSPFSRIYEWIYNICKLRIA